MQTRVGIFIVIVGLVAAIAGCNMMVTANSCLSTMGPDMHFTARYNEALAAKNTGNILLDVGVYLVIAGVVAIAWKRQRRNRKVENAIKTEQTSEVL
jgi:uncharacterized membrane protein